MRYLVGVLLVVAGVAALVWIGYLVDPRLGCAAVACLAILVGAAIVDD